MIPQSSSSDDVGRNRHDKMQCEVYRPRHELRKGGASYTYVFTIITRDISQSQDLPLSLTKGNPLQTTRSKATRLLHIMTSSGIGFDGFIKIPDRPLNFVPAKAGETIHLGQITCRILEDGSRTGMTPMRLC